MPPFYPPVSLLLLGMDSTIWIGLYRQAGMPRHWLVLTGEGGSMGLATTPAGFIPYEVSRDLVWGKEEDSTGVEAVVRYRVEGWKEPIR